MKNDNLHTALRDFQAARSRASLRELLSRFTGQPKGLLSYDEVRQKLKAQVGSERGLRDVPLDAIVGSVNRYEDFTRDFLPRGNVEGQRWARIKLAGDDLAGLPPIDVYQIGDAYFVKDGNHRVSVARQRGDITIQAYVTQLKTAVPLSPDDSPDDLIIKAEYTDFLAHTHINDIRPQADLTVTSPGQYEVLEEHIAVHRYYMGIDFQRDIPLEEAVAHWYDTVYLPIVRVIWQRDLLDDFPTRTKTDLYLWLVEHRAQLAEELSMDVPAEAAADDLSSRYSLRVERVALRLGEKVLDAVTPDALEGGPPPGHWRRKKKRIASLERLFEDVLVAVGPEDSALSALEQALILARLDGSHLHGLHVVADKSDQNNSQALFLEQEFDRRCREEQIPGSMSLVTSINITRRINERARWNDLLIFRLSHPPANQTLARLSSGIRHLLQRCPIPVLAVPGGNNPSRKFPRVSSLTHALLAYDGSPKAREALYVAAYLAKKWQLAISIVTIFQEPKVRERIQAQAHEYLMRQGLQAEVITANGPVATVILLTAETSHCDLILMGGYSRGPLLNIFIDDVVDRVLREANCPVLLCR